MDEQWTDRWSRRGKLTASMPRSSRKPNPNMISFGFGDPDAPTLPLEAMAEAAEDLAENQRYDALGYADAVRGDELNAALAEKLKRDQGIDARPEQILISSGGSGGLSLLTDMLLDPGDTILIDAPAWMGATKMFRLAGVRMVGVPVDEHGIDPALVAERYDQLAREGRTPKLLYTIPTFQNPSGVELSLERRHQLAEIANARDLLVVEDDAYNDLRFRGEKKPTIYSLLKPGNGLFFGTLSKTIAAGLRLGYMVGPAEIVAVMAAGALDSLRNSYSAALADWFLRSGHLEEHIKELREVYGAKADHLLAALEREMPEGTSWTKPNGGFFIWLTLPEGVEAAAIQPAARAAGVDFIPGPAFFGDGGGERNLRLSYSALTPEQIDEGTRRLASVIRAAVPAPAAR
ncbi:MAG TPA: PLP-dependent aminotransferase family protein [Thermomicrobiaceae bacterium]|nr:PLP-dependent aminotransferase family protein [Thermomicrobiaceae bacterium]